MDWQIWLMGFKGGGDGWIWYDWVGQGLTAFDSGDRSTAEPGDGSKAETSATDLFRFFTALSFRAVVFGYVNTFIREES